MVTSSSDPEEPVIQQSHMYSQHFCHPVCQDHPGRVGTIIKREKPQAQIFIQLIQINETHAISCSG